MAWITGGSRGLGYLPAREFARQECRVAICARDAAEIDRARDDLERHGAEVAAAQCDVGDYAHVEQAFIEISRRFGRVDVLVNNAGVIRVGPIHDMTVTDFEQALDVMFWGALHPTLAVLPQMLKCKSGRIVNITSIGGKASVRHLVPYICAKWETRSVHRPAARALPNVAGAGRARR